jgi:hypothetical protein
MNDPLANWRSNPFFLLDLSTRASRTEAERAGQKLLGLLAVGSADAARYESPFGSAVRDADAVRQAMGLLRDPGERVAYELWADVKRRSDDTPGKSAQAAWTGAGRAIGWIAPWKA